MNIVQLEFPLSKAEYLLNFTTESGKGGDKRIFWRSVMGFSSSEDLRTEFLKKVSPDMLDYQKQNDYGKIYQAVINMAGQSGVICKIRSVWIVPFGQDTARFVTAFPEKRGGICSDCSIL